MTFRIIGQKPDSQCSVIAIGCGDFSMEESGCVDIRLVTVKKTDKCTEFIYFSEAFSKTEAKKLN
jgi:hypothetical protein